MSSDPLLDRHAPVNLAPIINIARHIEQFQSLDEILHLIATESRRSLDVDEVFIYCTQPNDQPTLVAQATGASRKTLSNLQSVPPLTLPQSLWGAGAHWLAVNDIQDDIQTDEHLQRMSQQLVQWLSMLHVRAVVVIPIYVNNQIWGTILAQQLHQPRIWQPEEIDALELITIHLAIAIQKTELAIKTRQSLTKMQQTQRTLHHAMAAWGTSEIRYQALVAGMPSAIYLATLDQKLSRIYTSPQIDGFLGYALTDWQTNPDIWSRHLHPDDRDRVLSAVATQLHPDQPLIQEYRMVTRTQDVIWVQDYANLILVENQLLCVQGMLLDVTQSKQIEEALRLQAQQERLMNEMIQRIRQSLDLTNILETAAHEMQQFLGCDRAIILQFAPDPDEGTIITSAHSSIEPIQNPAVLVSYLISRFGSVYQDSCIATIENMRLAKLQPKYRNAFIRECVNAQLAVPIPEGQGIWGALVAQSASERPWLLSESDALQQLAGQLSIAIQQSDLYQQLQTLTKGLEGEVEERTAQLRELLNFEASLKRITDRVRDNLDEGHIMHAAIEELAHILGVVRCDIGVFNFENHQVQIAYEYNESGIIPFPNKFCSMSEFSDVLPQLMMGDSLQFCETYSRSFQARWAPLSTLACPISDDQGVIGDLWIFRSAADVFSPTEIRLTQQVANQCAIAIRQSRLYQASQAQVQELERINGLKDDFLSTVSHELRTPMSSIAMATQLLEMVLNENGTLHSSSRASRYFKILHEECQRETALINDLLDLSRLEAESEPLLLSTLDLSDWLAHVIVTFEERARQKNQTLRFEAADQECLLTTDYGYLERIIVELLNNACKYTPVNENIVVSIAQLDPASVASGDLKRSPLFRITVQNSGIEISLDECDRVFDRFYRIPNADPWKHGGTGLGLALVKKLMTYLNGQIELESCHGWTTFRLNVPSMQISN